MCRTISTVARTNDQDHEKSCASCKKYYVKEVHCIVVSTGRRIRGWYHLGCYESVTTRIRASCSSEIEQYQLLTEFEINILTKSLWPNQVSISGRAKLQIVKELRLMNEKELKLELEKRDLSLKIRRIRINEDVKLNKLRERLKKYLLNDECKKIHHLIVMGYCNKIQKNYWHLNVPMYLQQIVLKYYPPVLY
eukprot:373615_1